MLYGLADCNNFFCSCERVFHPELCGKPVVVLSNNDGCVVARSNESKALGIKMGDVFYQVRGLLERNSVAVFSSNYTLYGDMSARVMSMLRRAVPAIEQYSIDEAFLHVDGLCPDIDQLADYLRRMIRDIGRGTGIPISVGVAPTKTLAKVATRFAKRYPGYRGVCIIDTAEKRTKALALTEIGDVWGIGRRLRRKLEGLSIRTALDFTVRMTETQVRSLMSITGVRTWRELQGYDCVGIHELPRKKSICTSRSFPDQGLDTLADVEEAVANFASQCVRKLRRDRSACRAISIFAYTSAFREDLPSHYIQSTVELPVASGELPVIVGAAVEALRERWVEDHRFRYKKAGVIVWDICDDSAVQLSLFEDTSRRDKLRAVQKAVDRINTSQGYNTVRTGMQAGTRRWHLKNEYISRHYTTDLRDIITVKTDG